MHRGTCNRTGKHKSICLTNLACASSHANRIDKVKMHAEMWFEMCSHWALTQPSNTRPSPDGCPFGSLWVVAKGEGSKDFCLLSTHERLQRTLTFATVRSENAVNREKLSRHQEQNLQLTYSITPPKNKQKKRGWWQTPQILFLWQEKQTPGIIAKHAKKSQSITARPLTWPAASLPHVLDVRI